MGDDPTIPNVRRYRMTLWASVPLDGGEPLYTPRELEKHILQNLRKAEPDFELDVLDYVDSVEE